MKLKTDTINVAATPTQQGGLCRWLMTLLMLLMTTAETNMNTMLAATGTTETKEQQEVTWTLKPNGTIGDPSQGEVEQAYALTINVQEENTTIEFESENCPWQIYEDYINSITIVGAKYIGSNAFQSYQNLTTLCITDDPDDNSFQLSEIRERTFSQCPKLTTVRLNMDALPVLGEKVFDECPSLTVIIVPEEVYENSLDVEGWTDELKAKLGFGGTFMAGYDEDVELAWTLQPNGKLLDEYGHETGETTYALTLEAIGDIRIISAGSDYPWESFKYNITSITIRGAETIGNNVFDDYINLTKLTIADVDGESIYLREIESYAFSSCPKLTTVVLKVGSLPVLNEDAFYYCDALMRIIVPAEIFKDSEETNVEGWTDDLKSMLCMGDTFMAGDEKDVELFWTLQPNGTTIVDPDSHEEATAYALTIEVSGSNRNISFDNDSDIPWISYQTVITSISIMGAEKIGDNAFHNYGNLTTVYIANNPNEDRFSLLQIDNAFSSCNSLTTVRLNVSYLPILGNDVFGSQLTQIVVPAEVYEDALDTGVDGWTDELKAKLCVGGVCGKNGINDARVVWTLTDADGDGTAETLTIEGAGQMADFYSGETPWFAFKTDITRVIIGYGVRSIGEYAFQGCTNLAMMIICGNEMQNSEYGYVQLNNANALDGCDALTHIIVPLDTDYDEGTWDDDDLQEIIFHGGFCGKNGVRGDNMVWIMTDDSDNTLNIEGTGAMADYEDANDVPWDLWTVKDVVVGDEVTTIGVNAFYAFSENTSVSTIRMKSETPPTLPEGAFDKLQELTVIAVPSAALSTYKDADGWRAYADKIKGGIFLPPTQLTAEMTDLETVTVIYSAPKTYSTVTGYAYQYKKADEEEWSDEETTTGTTVNLTGLTYGANYQFRVRTLYEGGEASEQYATVSFDAVYYFKKPANLARSSLTDEEGTMSWEPSQSAYNITGYAYHFRRNDEEDWSATTTVGPDITSATVSGLAANKVYVFGVTALYEDGYASSDETLSFTTNVSLPYEDSFENGIGGWNVGGITGTGIHEQDGYTHSGSHGFKFAQANSIQTITVPLPDFGVPIRVSFYYKNYNDGQTSYRAKFQVGYSTEPSARINTFTWGDETLSSNLWKLCTADFPAGTTAVGIKWADGYELYIDDFSIRGTTSFAIADKADNTAIFIGKDGYQGDVTLQGRTLWMDNEWNTLCLPFSMTAQQIADSPLAHAVIRELDAETSNLTDGTLTLNFKKSTSLAAGKPYLVKWEVASASFTIESPVIENVTIDCGETPVVNFDGGQFVGSYSPVALPLNDRSNLFLGAKNTLYWPSGTNYEDFPDLDGANSSNFYLGSCRAYFHIGSPSGVRAFVLNIDESEQTGIMTIFADDRKPSSSNAATGIYTLDGRRVATDFDKRSPNRLPKGVYIVNGRKVAIK